MFLVLAWAAIGPLAGLAHAGDEFITLQSSTAAYPAGELNAIGRGRAPGEGMPAVTLRRRAENVALAVMLTHDGRQAEQRNRELMETLQRLVDRAATTPGIRIHNGRIDLSTRDRKAVSFGSYGTETRVDLFVLAALPGEKSALEVTNSIKAFLSGVEPVGQTRITEGSVGLSIIDPDQYRRQLLERIVEEVHFVTSKLGGSSTVALAGLDRPLAVRQRSDTEVELVIPYSYTIEYRSK